MAGVVFQNAEDLIVGQPIAFPIVGEASTGGIQPVEPHSGADPQIAGAALMEVVDIIVGQTVAVRRVVAVVDQDCGGLKVEQSLVGSIPQDAGAIFHDQRDTVLRHVTAKARKSAGLGLEAAQAVNGADPDPALAVLVDRLCRVAVEAGGVVGSNRPQSRPKGHPCDLDRWSTRRCGSGSAHRLDHGDV